MADLITEEMTIPAHLLAQLAPNRLPEPVGYWPPAPGWWALGLIVVALVLVCGSLFRRWRRRAYRRQARRQLVQIAQQADSIQDLARGCSQLLKGICIYQLNLPACAPMSQQRWGEFLQHYCPRPLDSQTLELLCHYADPARYRQQSPQQRAALVTLTQTWIDKHHV